MGQINQVYPVVEAALSLEDCRSLPSGHERKLTGDIVGIRPPDVGVGRKEMKRFLWLRVEGLEELEFQGLAGPLAFSKTEVYDKCRYCVPLKRLKEVDPDFDIEKALDPDLTYQPYLLTDEETGLFLATAPVFSVHGLIFDKLTGEYL